MNEDRFMILIRVFILLAATAVFVQTVSAAEPTIASGGCALVEKGAYAEAVSLLGKELSANPDDQRAEFCLGVALSRQGDKSAAIYLKRALMRNPGDPEIHLELGRYYYGQNIPSEAGDFLGDAVNLAPQSRFAKDADIYLRKLEKASQPKPWSLLLRGGLQYDSNVILNGENQPLPAGYSGRSDSSAIGIFKAQYSPVFTPTRRVSLGYSLYQSLHFKLDKFDITQNLLELSAEQTVSKNVSLRCLYGFEYLQLGGDEYDQAHRLIPELLWENPRFGTTILRYGLSSTRYKSTPRFIDNPDRDGLNHQIGVTQRYPLSASVQLLGNYRYESERAELTNYSFNGNHLSMGLQLKLPAKCFADISADYDGRNYRGQDPATAKIRHDKMTTISATLSKGLTKMTKLALGVADSQNRSNIDSYDYKRIMASLFLTAEF